MIEWTGKTVLCTKMLTNCTYFCYKAVVDSLFFFSPYSRKKKYKRAAYLFIYDERLVKMKILCSCRKSYVGSHKLNHSLEYLKPLRHFVILLL